MDDRGQQLDLIDVPPIAKVPPADPSPPSASAETTADDDTRARAQALAREWWYPMTERRHRSIELCAYDIGVALEAESLSLSLSDRLTEAFDAAAWALARTSWDAGYTEVTDVARLVLDAMRSQIGMAPSERRAMDLAVESHQDYRRAQAELTLEGGSDDGV